MMKSIPDQYGGSNGLKPILDKISTQEPKEKIPADPLVLIATDILGMPFGKMLEFGEQLAKHNKVLDKASNSDGITNAMMMHEWAKVTIEEWKKEYQK